MAQKPYKIEIKEEVFHKLGIPNEDQKDWSKGSTLTRIAWLKVRNKINELIDDGSLVLE